MRNFTMRMPFSPVALSSAAVAVLALVYIALIAVVMGYAALTIEFSQSVRNEESVVAELEATYLARVKDVTVLDYRAAGYVKPISETYVPAKSVTALR